MKQVSLLPNKEGFEFMAILKDGSRVNAVVVKDDNGLHRFAEFNKTIGWIPLNYR